IGIAVALLLMLMPLPGMIQPLKPYWLALVLIYWSLESADRVSIGLAFGVGLAADLLNGALLGDQALRLAVLVFIALRFRSRLRFFPMWQQSLAVFLLLLNNHVLQGVIRRCRRCRGWRPRWARRSGRSCFCCWMTSTRACVARARSRHGRARRAEG